MDALKSDAAPELSLTDWNGIKGRLVCSEDRSSTYQALLPPRDFVQMMLTPMRHIVSGVGEVAFCYGDDGHSQHAVVYG